MAESDSAAPRCGDSNAELLSAAEAGDAGAAALLLYVLACPELDVNHRDRFGRTPLFLAASMGHELVVRALLNHAGVDVNAAKSSDGYTPLIAAASNNNTAVVQMILAADAGMRRLKWLALQGYSYGQVNWLGGIGFTMLPHPA